MSDTINDAVLARRTHKVIGEVEAPLAGDAPARDMLDQLVSVAGNAPVHYPCDRVHLGDFTSPVPWRAYKLDQKACRSLMATLLENGDQTKVPNMLAAADFLVQVTWLPDDGTIRNAAAGKEEVAFDGTMRNMEHIAAGSAFIQSLLLLAENAGFRTYWSSGGPLRSSAVFEHLGISQAELLLGSIFLYPQHVGEAEVKEGNMRTKRGDLSAWSKWTGS